MTTRHWGIVSACLLALASASANAALVSRLGGLAVYDTDLNITWIADAKLSASNTFGTVGVHPTTGAMDWDTAKSWIANMNDANYLGFSDWRLPTTLDPDPSCTSFANGTNPSGDSTGYNCTGSEMGHLFYSEFGATAGTSVGSSGKTEELAKFVNISHSAYWSGTVFNSESNLVWSFNFGDGRQVNNFYGGYGAYAMVVRSGDVGGVSAVPLPAAVWLFGGGLIGLLGVARRKH